MKWAAKWSKKPRKRAVVTIFASGLTAASFSKRLEKLMLENTDAHKEPILVPVQTIMLSGARQQTGSH